MGVCSSHVHHPPHSSSIFVHDFISLGHAASKLLATFTSPRSHKHRDLHLLRNPPQLLILASRQSNYPSLHAVKERAVILRNDLPPVEHVYDRLGFPYDNTRLWGDTSGSGTWLAGSCLGSALFIAHWTLFTLHYFFPLSLYFGSFGTVVWRPKLDESALLKKHFEYNFLMSFLIAGVLVSRITFSNSLQ